MSKIEWTEVTWNPLRGCRRISPGCEHCYAERQAGRPILSGPGKPYEGLVQIGRQGARWTGQSGGPTGDLLAAPLSWKRGRMVFPCSMSDLFFEAHLFMLIAAVFGVMAATPQHTYQVLTKRPARALSFFAHLQDLADRGGVTPLDVCLLQARNLGAEVGDPHPEVWPLPNVWIGVSVENQHYAQERIPLLLELPAALRWISAEPLLEELDLRPWLEPSGWDRETVSGEGATFVQTHTIPAAQAPRLDWVVVGGESGPGARPFDLRWARQLVVQTAAAGTPCFVKQMGASPREYVVTRVGQDAYGNVDDDGHWAPLKYVDKKGGDPAEWPQDLQIRQFPKSK